MSSAKTNLALPPVFTPETEVVSAARLQLDELEDKDIELIMAAMRLIHRNAAVGTDECLRSRKIHQALVRARIANNNGDK